MRKRTSPQLAETVSSSSRPWPSPATGNLLNWNEIPDWVKDNEYIITGYRRQQNHWMGCFESVYLYVHNETVNIHSHLWGALIFLYLLMQIPYSLEPYSKAWIDFFMFSIFLISAIACLSASALFHTSACHSEKVASRCHMLDYSGIVVLIVGSFYPCIYYGFFCDRRYQFFYITSITILGSIAAYVVLNPEYSKPTHRGTRTTVFIALGLSAVVPVGHQFAIQNLHHLLSDMGLQWLVLSGCLYIGGALLYANRIPERMAPGKFDFYFASHQLFHLAVVLAALCHYYSILTAMKHLHSVQPLCGCA